MSCGAPDVRARAYVTATTVTVSIAATGAAMAVTVGCAQHPQRTHSAGQFPSGAVSVTDVQVSGETNAIKPEASARRIAKAAQRKARSKLPLYSTIRARPASPAGRQRLERPSAHRAVAGAAHRMGAATCSQIPFCSTHSKRAFPSCLWTTTSVGAKPPVLWGRMKTSTSVVNREHATVSFCFVLHITRDALGQ